MSFANLVTPLVSCDIRLCDASIVSIAKVNIPRSSGAPAVKCVVRWGDVNYPLSDRFGNIKGQSWEVEIDDESGEWRGRLALSSSNRFYKRWEAVLYAESNAARLAGTARRPLARGRCIAARVDEQNVTLTFSDELSRHDSQFSLDRECPPVLIGDVFGPDSTATGITFLTAPADEIAAEPMPICLGEASDEYRAAENPPITPIGIHKLRDMGNVLLANGSEVWRCYLVCIYACYSLPALFGSNQHPECPGSVRLDPDVFSGQFLVPGHGNYSDYFSTVYIDVTKGGKTYRCTLIFGRGPISDAHIDGKVPLSINVNGVEENGDGSGDLVDDLAYMLQILIHILVTQTLIGDWQTMPTFFDSVPKYVSSSFAALKAIHDARLSSRYRGGMILDKQNSARQALADLLVSADARLGIDNHGAVFVSGFDELADISALTELTAKHVKDGTFKITSELGAELENSLAYEFGPEPASGRLTGGKRPMTVDGSIDDWGDVYKADDITFVAIYRPDVASDVASHRLRKTRDGITLGQFEIDFVGLDLHGGQLVRNTDFRGLGSTGWTQRVLIVTERIAHLNEDEFTVTVTWEDTHEALVAPEGLVGGGGTSDGETTSRIGFMPVGNDADGDAWVVGNASDHTAWRVA
jgi:hypothetical protein